MVVSMSREDDFLKIIHENYVNQQKPKKEWEILRDRIMSDNISDEYWWGLKEDVDSFNSIVSELKQRQTENRRQYRIRLHKKKDIFLICFSRLVFK